MRNRTRDDSGFTLIELLVVIIILGILSAVVVFAVRGVGDKGDAAALATDKRTIRTALEAFCAQNSEYPDGVGYLDPMDELVQKKFLSDRSTLHGLRTQGTGLTEGNCNGGKYLITGDPVIPSDPPTVCVATNAWCVAAPPVTNVMIHSGTRVAPVKLTNGTYLAGSSVYPGEPGSPTPYGAEIYDPDPAGAGAVPVGTGRWIQVPKPPGSPAGSPSPRNMVALDNGKVLVSYDYGAAPWQLYDPLAPPGSEWTAVNGNFKRTYCCLAMAKITGSTAQCGTSCGKVLIVGGEYEDVTTSSKTPPVAELFDPDNNQFAISDTYPPLAVTWTLKALGDGTVLMVGGNQAFVFDPTLPPPLPPLEPVGKFMPVTPPLFDHGTGPADEAALTTDGGVLVTANARSTPPDYRARAEMYTPTARAAGTWSEVDTCAVLLDEVCHLLAPLADGRILAAVGAFVGPAEKVTQMTALFDPVSLTWIQERATLDSLDTAGGSNRRDGPAAIELTLPNCGSLCGKVLLGGNKSAELYTPPSA